jgi:CRP/FNR family transcriptional regulator, anaerobic regulatory protein
MRIEPEVREMISGLRTGQIRYPENAMLVDAGQPGGALQTIYDGWAFSYLILPDGGRQIISFLLPGDFVSVEMALDRPAHASVRALTPVILCTFNPQALRELTEANPKVGDHLLRSMLSDVHVLERRIVSLGRRNAAERLARLLLCLFERSVAMKKSIGNSCYFPATQRHLADALGLTPTHVSTTLRQLREQGILTLSDRLLTILDMQRIQSFSGPSPYLGDKFLM